MKLRALSRSEVRSIDTTAMEQYAMPGICLMENAGRGAAEVIHRVSPTGPVVLLCGRGNNGGDGFVIARHLELFDREVRIVLLAESTALAGDAKINWLVAQGSGIPIEMIADPTEDQLRRATAGAAVLVDALLGTGASGDPRGPFQLAIEIANQSDALRIAVDIPSGLDCDSGEPGKPCFKADHTCSFVAPKLGFANPSAVPWIGQVHVIPIGAPAAVLRGFVER